MDILEPMRRAAELGCKDFKVRMSDVVFIQDNIEYDSDNCYYATADREISLPDTSNRINRYAACRCECWWREEHQKRQKLFIETASNDNRAASVEARRMIDLCRAFANEHGK